MTGKWFYSHAGVIHGPFSIEEIKEQAARRKLLETDIVWQGENGRNDALAAQAAIDFANLPLLPSSSLDWLEDVVNGAAKGPLVASTASNEAPDWLADVALMESKRPLPGPEPSKERPVWLDDLRLWFSLEHYADAKAQSCADAAWPTPEARSKQEGGATANEPNKEAMTPLPPLARPAAITMPFSSPGPAARPKPTGPSFSPTASPPHQVPPGEPPTEKAIPTPRAEDPLAERAIKEAGFDPNTGQVLDADKFRKWQKSSSSKQPGVTNESVLEVFHKGCIAIQNWVDDDDHRALVMAGDMDAIKVDVSLVALLRRFQGHGPAMQEKLRQCLGFLVENRRKYYTASRRLNEGVKDAR